MSRLLTWSLIIVALGIGLTWMLKSAQEHPLPLAQQAPLPAPRPAPPLTVGERAGEITKTAVDATIATGEKIAQKTAEQGKVVATSVENAATAIAEQTSAAATKVSETTKSLVDETTKQVSEAAKQVGEAAHETANKASALTDELLKSIQTPAKETPKP